MTMHDDHNHDHDAADPRADRINEAYYDAMGAAFGQKTRDRINWMCANARGLTVLDVGCSQGIAAILMAREGLVVTGLDIYPPAIEYAMAERAKEIASVQQRLEFRCGELAALGEGQYDTVVMGEVVEHQTNPVRFIRQGAARIAPGGRVIITVPYGLHPWPDHKSSIFPRDLHEAIADEFALQTIAVTDGYIRVVADRRRAGEPVDDDMDMLLRVTETGAINAQTSYYAANATAQEHAKARGTLEHNLKGMRDAQGAMVARQGELELALAVGTERASGLQAAFDNACQAVADRGAEHAEALRAQREEHAHALRTLREDHVERMRVQESLADAYSRRVDELMQQLVTLQAEMSDVRAAERIAISRVQALQSEVEALHDAEGMRSRALDEALGAAHARTQELQAAADEVKTRMHKMAVELTEAQEKRSGHWAKLEAEQARSKKLIALAQTLHEDNQRYEHSIALAIGRAVLGLGSVRGLIGFPRAMARVVRLYQRRRNGMLPVVSLVLPPLPKPSAVAEKAECASASAKAANQASPQHRNEEQKIELAVIGWEHENPNGFIPVMSVLDEFSRACFAPQASLIEPRPDNWQGLLETCKPRFLLVESSWKGNYGTWQYRVSNYANPPGCELEEMVAGFRARGIPTVFWNKEDPVHFTNFIDNAEKFDVVLTTASEAVSRYQERTNARVGVLQFAAEESLHNPVGSVQRNGKVCFAGSFYANRFRERQDDQLMLLDAASTFDFDIFDRNYQPDATGTSDFAFPEQFTQFVRGRLPYDAIGRAYREYRVFLNVNSVIDSPTMFSRRVFELLACGTPVVSTWSRGTEETFGEDLIWHVRNREEAEEAIRVLMTDDREWRRRSLAGIRAVFAGHTYRHRFGQILELLGLERHEVDPFGEVLVVAEAAGQAEADAVQDSFRRQSMSAGVKKRLLLVKRGDFSINGTDGPTDVVAGDGSLLDTIESARRQNRAGMLALMSPFGMYGRYYLQDLLHAARYSAAGVVGKSKDGLESSQYKFDTALDPHAVVINEKKLTATGAGLDAILRGDLPVSSQGQGHVYASDSANYRRMNAVPGPVQVDEFIRQMEF